MTRNLREGRLTILPPDANDFSRYLLDHRARWGHDKLGIYSISGGNLAKRPYCNDIIPPWQASMCVGKSYSLTRNRSTPTPSIVVSLESQRNCVLKRTKTINTILIRNDRNHYFYYYSFGSSYPFHRLESPAHPMDYKRARYTISEGGVRIIFGDAYWGLQAAPVPEGCLCHQDRIAKNYSHIGTIAFEGRTRDFLDHRVLLMQSAIRHNLF
jgi:hypothetical protein